MSSRRNPLPVEDSWRMVEGEHDSFDTTILPSLNDSPPAPPSSGLPSQFSQGQLSFDGASQDSIGDFARSQDDEHEVILREPFRPSLSSVNILPGASGEFRTPDPQFRMPRVDVQSDRRARDNGLGIGWERDHGVRRRGKATNDSPTKLRGDGRQSDQHHQGQRSPTIRDQLAVSLPAALYSIVLYLLALLTLALRYAQRPLAILLALYLSFGGLILAQNMLTRSLSASLSPVCRLPGANLLHLPFCPSPDAIVPGPDATVEFDDLMGVQAQFEQVLQKSADGVSLPFEMKRSETTIRDLRSLVRHSDIQARDELVLEFDGYIDTARRTATDLQKFNTHVGSAVDAVISINRWTSRYIDALAPEGAAAADDPITSPSLLVDWAAWLFHPFHPTDVAFNERVLLDHAGRSAPAHPG
ncbi:hypothetical protein G7046_g9889 [Stylonectria norvegica]|nr:hypothetical protein G7046_g9889 [Stylonectria norvegica]